MTRRRTAIVAAYAGIVAVLLGLGTGVLHVGWLVNWLWSHAEADHGWLGQALWDLLAHGVSNLLDAFGLVAACCSAVAVAALVVRAAAWRRMLRQGEADPLGAFRRRPWAVRLAAVVPALAYLLRAGHDWFDFTAGLDAHRLFLDGVPMLAIALGIGKLSESVVKEAVAPLANEDAPSAPRDERDIAFSAVAVTPRTRAAVGGLALASVAVALWVVAVPLVTLQGAAFDWFITAYVAVAAGAALAFRRASRVAVGIDGVYVGEAASTRFFAYRDIDEVRAAGADLELLREGRVVLRLQLHGDDAGRRDEVLARIAEAIGRARSGETRGAEALVQSMAARRKAIAAAVEPPSYREPTITREHLWELVEGAATDAPTRTAAAEALALTLPLDGDERSRLRVAASRVADPRVRVALGSLARDEEGEEADAESERERERSLSG